MTSESTVKKIALTPKNSKSIAEFAALIRLAAEKSGAAFMTPRRRQAQPQVKNALGAAVLGMPADLIE